MKINEITDQKTTALKKIKADCKPFLKIIGYDINEYPLYRGMSGTGFQHKTVRLTNRSPMSTALTKHDRYNHYFEETFGQPFRNSMFASGSIQMAFFYGRVFRVFPIGNFDWLWSPQIEDIALDIKWPIIGGQHNVPPSQEAVNAKLDTLDYNMNSDIRGAIKSGNEIMIRCSEYYAVLESVFKDAAQ